MEAAKTETGDVMGALRALTPEAVDEQFERATLGHAALLAKSRAELAGLRKLRALVGTFHQEQENGRSGRVAARTKTRKGRKGRRPFLEEVREYLSKHGPAKTSAVAAALERSSGGLSTLLNANPKIFRKTPEGWEVKG